MQPAQLSSARGGASIQPHLHVYVSFSFADREMGARARLGTRAGQSQRPKAFLPFGPHPLIRGNVDGVRDCIMADSQAQVCDGTHAIFLHQDVL